MVKNVVFIVLFLTIVNYSYQLSCYNCTSASRECKPESFDKWKSKKIQCNPTASNSPNYGPACLLSTVTDQNTKMVTTTRMCLHSINGTKDYCSPPTVFGKINNFKITYCSICTIDDCNKSSKISSANPALFLIPLWFIFAKIISI